MKIQTFCNFMAVVSLLLSTNSSFASSQCDHSFTCIGKASGDEGIIWLRDSASGACGDYDVLGLIIPRKDSAIYLASVLSLKLLEPLTATSRWEQMEELRDSGGVFYSNTGFFVTPPQYDTLFDSVLRQLAIDSMLDRAPDMIRIGSRYSYDLPTVNLWTPDFIWSHQNGLYKNYKLRKVYWFPESKMLIILTNQPRMAMGDDTMHGVLVLKVDANKTKKK